MSFEQITTAIANAVASLNTPADGVPQYLIPDRDYWVPIDQVHHFLGRGWSADSIRERINNGELKEKKHFRDERIETSRKSNIKVNVYAVNRYLSSR